MTMQTSQSERETTSGDCVHIVRTKPLYVHNVYMQKTNSNSNSNDDDQNRYTSFYIPNACDRPRCPFLHLYPFFLCFSLSFSIQNPFPFIFTALLFLTASRSHALHLHIRRSQIFIHLHEHTHIHAHCQHF